MRAVVVAVVVLVVGCGPPAAEVERCEEAPECLNLETQVCEGSCLELARINADRLDCCECLEELDCTDLPAERCASNLEDGGSIRANAFCAEDRGLCGTACGDVLDFD